jgi:hypothetical protein
MIHSSHWNRVRCGSFASAFPCLCTNGASFALNLCARADNDIDALAIDSPSSSSRLQQAPNRFSSLNFLGSYGVCAHPPTPTLTMDSAYLLSARACTRTLIPVIRTRDHDKSMRPSRATLYYAVVGSSTIHAVSVRSSSVQILGVTFLCSTRIPYYLRSNPRGSNTGYGYPLICPFRGSLKVNLDQRVRLPCTSMMPF